MASIKKRPNGSWRARYRDADGKEHARHFKYKDKPSDPENSAQHWLDTVTAAVMTGTYVDPDSSKVTMNQWCDAWILGYSSHRASTVTQAKTHLKLIRGKFGSRALVSIRPSEIRAWSTELLADGYAQSYVKALHSRLGQLFSDAMHDGIVPKSPVSRRTSPSAAPQRAFVATTEQIWALHDALPSNMRGILLLGAFVGLRRNEMVAAKTSDMDFMRGIFTPSVQYPNAPLKTAASRTPIPVPQSLVLELNKVPSSLKTDSFIASKDGKPVSPRIVNEVWREAREKVPGLPDGYRIHDLRHYFASMLISSGLDVKVVQARLRHTNASTTLDIYGHLWPDSDETSRSAVDAVVSAQFNSRADKMRTVASNT